MLMVSFLKVEVINERHHDRLPKSKGIERAGGVKKDVILKTVDVGVA